MPVQKPSEGLLNEQGIPDSVHHPRHYEGVGRFQPIDFIMPSWMGPGFAAGNIIKYVTRYKGKGGIEDLRKAHQYLAWLIQEEMIRETKGEEDE